MRDSHSQMSGERFAWVGNDMLDFLKLSFTLVL
jgi:hypothetical protein